MKVPCYISIFNYSVVPNVQSKQKPYASIAARLHGAARAAVGYSTRSIFTLIRSYYFRILQTALNVKGYPHLQVSFHCRLQVYINFSFEHKLSQKKNHI